MNGKGPQKSQSLPRKGKPEQEIAKGSKSRCWGSTSCQGKQSVLQWTRHTTRQQYSDLKNNKLMIYYIHQEKYIIEEGSPATQQIHPKEEVCQGGEGLSTMLVAPIAYITIKHLQGPPTGRSSSLGMPLG